VKAQQQRRLFLKGTFAGTAAIAAAGVGLIKPKALLAAWPEAAFKAESMSDSLNTLFGTDAMEESDLIKMKTPEIAENGKVVPVSVKAEMENVESVTILSEKNPTPMVARFNLKPGCDADVATRIKMGESSDVIAVVKSNGKLYTNRKHVKVTIGGCGG
jgi:sulfur-oxidizing protein SoxY